MVHKTRFLLLFPTAIPSLIKTVTSEILTIYVFTPRTLQRLKSTAPSSALSHFHLARYPYRSTPSPPIHLLSKNLVKDPLLPLITPLPLISSIPTYNPPFPAHAPPPLQTQTLARQFYRRLLGHLAFLFRTRQCRAVGGGRWSVPCWESGGGVLEYGDGEDVQDVRFQG